MPVIARDTVASDHLVYAWPFPIGPDDYEVSCADDELVVMCPAWLVGDRLGPGRHRWRSPDPTRQSAAYFVLTAPVEVSFDMITAFVVPATGQSVRLRSIGSLQVRCMDPALLVAQFVGLPFDSVNEGVLRSVSRSIERMLARLLTRRVVMAGTPQAVTDPQMLSNIVEELVAYNPTAGAVFGIELLRFGHLSIMADDGNRPWQQMTNGTGSHLPPPPQMPAAVVASRESPTMQQPIVAVPTTNPGGRTKPNAPTVPPPMASGSPRTTPPLPIPVQPSQPQVATSGEINVKPKSPKITAPGIAPPSGGTPAVPTIPSPTSGPAPVSTPIPKMPIAPSSTVSSASGATASGTLGGPKPPKRPGVETTDEPTQPGVDIVRTPVPGSQQAVSGEIGGPKPAPAAPPAPAPAAPDPAPAPAPAAPVAAPQAVPILAQGTPAPKSRAASESADSGSRGSIMGIGVSHIGSSEVASGEITKKIAPGGRVLVPGPNGLMQSATVRQLLSGYYELEVGGSGETIWVPVTGVVPE